MTLNSADLKTNRTNNISQRNRAQTHNLVINFAFLVSSNTDTSQHENSFLIDSGATVHIINDKDKFLCFNSSFVPENHVIQLADGTKASNVALAQGDATVLLQDHEGVNRELTLKNALYVPSFQQSIISVPAATKAGATVSFSDSSGTLSFKEHIFKICKTKNLYYINTLQHQTCKKNTLKGWHAVLGHCNASDILKLEEEAIGIKIVGDRNPNLNCETCVLGKMCDARNRQPDSRASKPLELVHIDLAGPIDPIAKDNFRYALICVDDFSNCTAVYFLKQKSDTCKAFRKFLSDLSAYGQVKKIRSDQGGEFISEEFSSILTEHLIHHEKSAPYSPHQNGTAERHWRTLFEMARCLLLDSKLPKFMWTYAVMASSYIRNRCFNSRLGKTPFQAMTGRKPNLSNMQTFGESCFAFNQNPKKLAPRSEKGIFVGYDRDSPAYLIYFPDKEIVKKVRRVKFLDSTDNEKAQSNDNENEQNIVTIDRGNSEDNHYSKSDETLQSEDDGFEEDTEKDVFTSASPSTQTGVTDNRPSKRKTTRPKYLDDYCCNDDELGDHLNIITHYCYSANFDIPQSYCEAISSNDASKWETAMMQEMKALKENETFDVVPLPKDRKLVGGKWVYAVKTDKEGSNIQGSLCSQRLLTS